MFPHAQQCFVRHLRDCMRSLAFCCVRLCTCGSACFELVLVSLCCQQSSVAHVRVNPSCLLSRCSVFERSTWVVVLTTSFLCFHRIYYVSMTGAHYPFCVGVHGWVARICQQSYLEAGCSKWKLLDVWRTQIPFRNAVVNDVLTDDIIVS